MSTVPARPRKKKGKPKYPNGAASVQKPLPAIPGGGPPRADGAPPGPMGYDPEQHAAPATAESQKKKNLDRLRKMGVLQGVMIMPSGMSTVPRGGYVAEDEGPQAALSGAAAAIAARRQQNQQPQTGGGLVAPGGSNNSDSGSPTSSPLVTGASGGGDADGAPELDLPPSPPWGEHLDPETGQTYFFNTETGQSAWTKPQEMIDAEEEHRRVLQARQQQQQAQAQATPVTAVGRGSYSAVRGRGPGLGTISGARGGSTLRLVGVGGRGIAQPHAAAASVAVGGGPAGSPNSVQQQDAQSPPASEAVAADSATAAADQQQPASGDSPTNELAGDDSAAATDGSAKPNGDSAAAADGEGDAALNGSPAAAAAAGDSAASADGGASGNENSKGEGDGEDGKPKKIRRWTAHLDPDTNRTYYFNVDTEESLWERPHEYFSEEDDDESSQQAPRGKSRWTAHEDPEYGEIYYYCAETAESVWIRPDDYWTDHEDHGAGDQSEDENDGIGADGYASGGDEVKSVASMDDCDPPGLDHQFSSNSILASGGGSAAGTPASSMPRQIPRGIGSLNSQFSGSFQHELPVQTDGSSPVPSPRSGAALSSPSMSIVSPTLQTDFDTSDGVRNIGVEHCGWLMKVAGYAFKPRWFQIFENRIRYFLDESCTKILGQIEIKSIRMVEVDSKKKKWGFNVEIPGRTYYFAANTKDDMMAWLSQLRRKCKAVNEGHMYGVESHHRMGMLKKQKQNSKKWKPRFFVLTNNALLYFQNEADATYYVNLTCFSRELHDKAAKRLLGSMTIVGPAIQNASVQRIGAHSNQQHCFRVSTGPRTMYLSCSKVQDLDEWMTSIEQRLNPPKPLEMAPPRSSMSTPQPPSAEPSKNAAMYGQQPLVPRAPMNAQAHPNVLRPQGSLADVHMDVPADIPPQPPIAEDAAAEAQQNKQLYEEEAPHAGVVRTSGDVSNPESSHTPEMTPAAGRTRPLPPSARAAAGGVATPLALANGAGAGSLAQSQQASAAASSPPAGTGADDAARSSISGSRADSTHSHSHHQMSVTSNSAAAEDGGDEQPPSESGVAAADDAPPPPAPADSEFEEKKMSQPPTAASHTPSPISAPSNASTPSASSSRGPTIARLSSAGMNSPPALAGKHPEDWGTEEVALWLRSLGKKIESYAEEFEENGIDGDFLFNVLTQETLAEVVEKKIHCSLIWRKVTKLRDEHSR